jgi:hypothetical protein
MTQSVGWAMGMNGIDSGAVYCENMQLTSTCSETQSYQDKRQNIIYKNPVNVIGIENQK